MKCINCGNEIQDGSVVCPICNYKIYENANVLNENQMNYQNQNVQAPLSYQNQVGTSNINSNEIINNQTPINNGTYNMNQQVAVNPNVNFSEPTIVGGEKIGESAPVIQKKKKNYLGILIALLVVIIIAGILVYAYIHEYKSANKRVEIFTKELFSFSQNINNKKIELSSGKYTVSAKMNNNNETYDITFDGKYGIDLKNKIMDYTLNITSLKSEEELIPSPLNVELYINKNKSYLLLQNFFDKYLSLDLDEADDYFDKVSKDNNNYMLLISSIKQAFMSALNTTNLNQSIKDVTINGKTSKANVVRFDFTAENQKTLINNFKRNLANNQTFIKELAKIEDEDEEKLKEDILKSIEETKVEEKVNTYIELYTPVFSSSLTGIKYVSKNSTNNETLEIYPVANGYGIVATEKDKVVLKLTMTKTIKRTSTYTENTIKLTGTSFQNDESTNFDVNIRIMEDTIPQVEKVIVKNSVDINKLSEEDINEIFTKMSQYGGILKDVDKYLNMVEKEEVVDNCSPEMNCTN